MKYTVLGSTGFIGSHVAALARQQGHAVDCPARNQCLNGRDLGHVVYAIGITADFRKRPHDTITAHVTRLQEILTGSTFDSLVYLSSTRVYARCGAGPVDETTPIPVLSTDFSDLYNLSKLMGESIALTHGARVKVARLSNVVGPDFDSDNFLMSVLRDCVTRGSVELGLALDSAKDYVSVEDVASILLRLGPEGRHPVYNIASGRQTTNQQIVTVLEQTTGARATFRAGAPNITFPPICIERVAEEFGFQPQAVEVMLPGLVKEYQRVQSSRSAA